MSPASAQSLPRFQLSVVSPPPAHWTSHLKIQGSPPLGTRDPYILVFIGPPISTPGIFTSLSPERLSLCWLPPGAPGPAPSWQQASPHPTHLGPEEGEGRQQAREEGGNELTEVAAGRHGAGVRHLRMGRFNRVPGGVRCWRGPAGLGRGLNRHLGPAATSCHFTMPQDQVSLWPQWEPGT